MSSIRESKPERSPKSVNRTQPARDRTGLPRAAFSTTIAKAVDIMEILASQAEGGASLSEISTRLRMPKSTAHRYLATLVELGLAERSDIDRFCLGTKVIELAGAYLSTSDLRIDSQGIMNEIANRLGETVHLAVPSGTEVIYIAKIESKHALGMFSHIGARLPMHCTALGKAILAFSSGECLQEVLAEQRIPRTPNTIVSEQALKAELAIVHSQGFAIDNEENEVGICCVGAPILNYAGLAIAAISVSGPRDRMDWERCIQLGPLVREAAMKVSKRKGFTGHLYP